MKNRTRSRIAALFLVSAVAGLVACGSGDTETSGSGDEAPAEPVATVPAGTMLTLELDETISTSSHSAGDAVTATVTEAVTADDGTVLVPVGSRMSGTVRESQRSDGPENPAVLAFEFRTLSVDGQSYPVTATVENAEPNRTAGDSDAESVAKVAIGTAAGALVGQILGGTEEATVGGAAAGTLAGAAIAITSQHGDATLRQGSRITVQIQEPVELS
ncbi:MAG: hypothetical protein ACN0LA_07605 [Candidatus Longimicrobiales bacterium M2_2A_002]